ncbi:MAG: hypothetical protein ACRD2D_03000 [Terriglobales bacterium]
MRSLLALPLLAAGLLAQMRFPLPPIPANSNEPINGSVRMLQTPAERAAGLNLLNIAGQNYTFGQQGRPDTVIEWSLQSHGNLRFEGTGDMTEVIAGGRVTWWTNFDNETSGMPYDLSSHPIPMRVAMARYAVLWPISRQPSLSAIRVANAEIAGKPVTCVLINQAVRLPTNAGRDWTEAEDCMDANGLLQFSSPAPGVFYIYDYSSPLQYAGHTVASTIHVIEGQDEVMTIQVARLGVPSNSDLEALRQSPRHAGLLTTGFAGVWQGWRDGASAVVNVVHVTVDPSGHFIESEVIPNGNPLSEQAALRALDQLRFLHRPHQRFEAEYWIRVSRP